MNGNPPFMQKVMDVKTLCVHGNNIKHDLTGSISVPIYQSATFAHPGVEKVPVLTIPVKRTRRGNILRKQ
jgi:O-acetylhomoserine/O-acetylserine sulfhydrylase-like pyridoxal-dependent enzyme